MTFEELSHDGKCEVCGAETEVIVLASSLGPVSHAYCADCISKGLEPYGTLVAYYSDSNAAAIFDFAKNNKDVLRDIYHKSNMDFIKDCSDAARSYKEYLASIREVELV